MRMVVRLPLAKPETLGALRALERQSWDFAPPNGTYDAARRNLELNVGRACNNHCAFCISGKAVFDEKMWVPLEKAKDEVRAARENGCTSLGFLGGEPTMYPHLLPVAAYAREIGYTRIALATNAMLLDDADFARRCVDAGITRATISFHAHTRRLEHAITKVGNAWDRKVAAIRNLKALQAAGFLPDNVSVNPVVNTLNFRHLPAMVRFFAGLGVDDVRFNFIRAGGNAEDTPELCPTFTALGPVLERVVEQNEARRRPLTITFGEFPYCVLPWTLHANEPLFRRYNGELRDYATDVSIFGSPKKEDDKRLRFSWQESKRNDLKQKADVCRSCRHDVACEGVWRAYVRLHGDSEIRAIRA